jgi:hypothetical protein
MNKVFSWLIILTFVVALVKALGRADTDMCRNYLADTDLTVQQINQACP